MEQKEATVWYEYDCNSRQGKILDEESTKIVVEYMNNNVKVPLDLDHPNLLKTLIRDRDANHIIYIGYTCTFNDWIESRVFIESYDVPDYNPDSRHKPAYPIDLDRPHTRVYYVPDEIRNVFKSLVDLIIFFHSKNYCIRSFGRDNLVMIADEVKFWNLELDECTDGGRRKDFKNLHAVLHPLISRYDAKNVPVDMLDFLKKLTEFPEENGSDNSISNHIAIVSSPKRLSLFRDWHEKQKSLTLQDGKLYRNVLKLNYNRIDNRGWNLRLKLFPPLEHIYHVNFLTNPNYATTCDDLVNQKRVNKSIVRFIRNVVSHGRENKSFENTQFLAHHIDAMIVSCFGDFILAMVDELHHYGLSPVIRSGI